MKLQYKIGIVLSVFVSCFFSQDTEVLPSSGVTVESGVLDGLYVKEHIPTKRTISYQSLRESDVIWEKKIWRTIDLKQRINYPLFYPLEPISDRRSLWDVIRYGVLNEGTLTIYEVGTDFDDQFKVPVVPADGNRQSDEFQKKLQSFFGEEEETPILDENDEPTYDDDGNALTKIIINDYTSRDIIRYEIKEVWFFDKQRSALDVRILGICPIVYGKNATTGEYNSLKQLFWLYFPECRYVFQNFYVYNTKNDAMRMSFDDLFWKRQFSSYVHKESNIYDRGISEPYDGIDALLESKRIENEIFVFEHDLWHF